VAKAFHPQAGDSTAVLIGPEGGWTDQERDQFTAAGWKAVSLGPFVLRAETAVCAALAVVAQQRLISARPAPEGSSLQSNLA
jgi:RsmE family RNA methyltransferase